MWLCRLVAVLTLWVGVKAGYSDYQCDGDRDVMVHLFEWRWDDIANECETVLGPKGFCGIQVSNPAEHRVVADPPYPWWQRYQPVSYIMQSRSGNQQQFVDMVTRCNNAGVRIYVDAVINHMTGGGTDATSAGSSFNGDTYDYPGVPYSINDFNQYLNLCPNADLGIYNWEDPNQARNCELSGLRDLRLDHDYVRGQLIAYLNQLISWGVAGFRIDAAKHMWPSDLQYIWDSLSDLPGTWFPAGTRPYFFLEIIQFGDTQGVIPEYVPGLGRHVEFRYGTNLGEVVRKWNGQKLAYLSNFGQAWGMTAPTDAVSFLSNHDNQRGHGGGGDLVLTFWEPREYKIGHTFMLGWEYGHVRIISSYFWQRDIVDGHDYNDWMGPPADASGNTDPVDCDQPWGQGWVCEHRWLPIANMVRFHNVAVGKRVTRWWDNGEQAIAFARGDDDAGPSVGYVVINNEVSDMTGRYFETGLPAGDYCDVITCDGPSPPCTGSGCRAAITVDASGWAPIDVPADDNPMVAIHV